LWNRVANFRTGS